eukprot:763959-Hanusia_phi.AAC.15
MAGKSQRRVLTGFGSRLSDHRARSLFHSRAAKLGEAEGIGSLNSEGPCLSLSVVNWTGLPGAVPPDGPRFLGLYEYPAWDYNVYAQPDMEVANCEPETTPWQHANADVITPEEYASCTDLSRLPKVAFHLRRATRATHHNWWCLQRYPGDT